MDNRTPVDSLRIATRELNALIAELNRAGEDFGGVSQRKLRRWAYTGMRISVEIVEHNGHKRRLAAAPRDLSAGGMCVLHGGFIHPGVECSVSLTQVSGSKNSIAGKVVRCRHVRGRLHESGIAFASHIRPEDYVAFGDGAVFHIEHVEPETLAGTVLVVMDDVPGQRLISHHLNETKLDLLVANDRNAALSMVEEHPNVTFVDKDVAGVDAITIVQALRSVGIVTPIALLVDQLNEDYRERAIEHGATEVLSKPVSRDLLMRAIADFIWRGGEPHGSHASASNGSSARDVELPLALLEEFVGELRTIAQTLDEHIEQNNTDALKRTLGHLHSSAAGYGFKKVASAAKDVSDKVGTADTQKLDPTLTADLINLCQSARAYP